MKNSPLQLTQGLPMLLGLHFWDLIVTHSEVLGVYRWINFPKLNNRSQITTQMQRGFHKVTLYKETRLIEDIYSASTVLGQAFSTNLDVSSLQREKLFVKKVTHYAGKTLAREKTEPSTFRLQSQGNT